MIRTGCCFLLSIIPLFYGFAQDLNFIARGNIGVGFDYLTQDFNGIKTFYSPGGGAGVEVGMEGEIQNDLFWYGTVGFTLNLDFHYEEIQGQTTQTSYGWNKKLIMAGVNQYYDPRIKFIENVFGGGGLTFGIPGILRRTENGGMTGSRGYKGRITYKPALGIQLHAGTTLDIGKNFMLRPDIRYRYIAYKAKDFTRGTVKSLEPGLKKARGDGMELGCTLVWKIRGSRY